MTIIKPITHAQFLIDVEAFLARHGMAEREIGLRSLNDSAFLGRIRAGKSPTLARLEAVYDFMIAVEAEANADQ